MIRGSRVLAVAALAVSGALHLSGASLFWRDSPVDIQGGTPATVARLGNSFQDVAQGTRAPDRPEDVQDAEPPESRAEQVRPDELAPTEPDLHVTQPVPERTEPAEAPREMRERRQTENTMRVRLETTVAQSLPTPPLRPEPTTAGHVEAVRPSPVSPDAPDGLEPEPEEPTVLAALSQEDDEIAPQISARPSLRPNAIEEAAHNAVPPKPRQQSKRKSASAPGSNQPQQVRGNTDGERNAEQTQAADRQSAAARQAGNAAASNYPGQVMRAIAGLRRPSVNSRGTATISFRIASNGALSGISLARSSGSQALDAAALDFVRRAAPFPAPPAGARRSFTIGIEGR